MSCSRYIDTWCVHVVRRIGCSVELYRVYCTRCRVAFLPRVSIIWVKQPRPVRPALCELHILCLCCSADRHLCGGRCVVGHVLDDGRSVEVLLDIAPGGRPRGKNIESSCSSADGVRVDLNTVEISQLRYIYQVFCRVIYRVVCSQNTHRQEGASNPSDE